jgi:CheY-like chemotaxis protein
MGGIALFHAIRKYELAIPFVIITGHSMEKDIENLRKLGLRGWLTKPPKLTKLGEMLHEILA